MIERRAFLQAVAAAPISVLFTGGRPAPGRALREQLRACWVDAFGPGLDSPSQIDQLVVDAGALHLNALFAQIVRRGDCFCTQAELPRTQAPIQPAPFDPLQALLDRAHGAGIEVHAWLSATAIWQGTTPPVAPDHVFNVHGPATAGPANWLTRRVDGKQQVGQTSYLDLGHPAAADFIVSMCTHVLTNYAVDGIHLDGLRYPDDNLGRNIPSWGYNPVALARFQAFFGRTDVPPPTDLAWTQWRRDQVTQVMRRIYLEADARKPEARISAATVAFGAGPTSAGGWQQTAAYAQVLQDWRGWLQEGILDLAIPMDYQPAHTAPGRYDDWGEFIKDHQYGRQAAIGSALFRNTVADSVSQIGRALAPSAAGNVAAGWVGYAYRTPDRWAATGQRPPDAGRAELAAALTRPSPTTTFQQPPFADIATVPAMLWKRNPTTGHLRGSSLTIAGAVLDGARVDLHDAGGQLVRSQRTDGLGWFGFVDLVPGVYSAVLTDTRSGLQAQAAGVVTAGRLVTLAAAATPGTAACQFVLGFSTLQRLLPQQVGRCLEDELHDSDSGDALQATSNGLLVWRKADNWTAFTDGYHTWINGPNGLQERLNTQRFPWEANPNGLPLAG